MEVVPELKIQVPVAMEEQEAEVLFLRQLEEDPEIHHHLVHHKVETELEVHHLTKLVAEEAEALLQTMVLIVMQEMVLLAQSQELIRLTPEVAEVLHKILHQADLVEQAEALLAEVELLELTH
tara:strand:+ start:74 stop:442 length:369 start_codon:yes stop_codon:yes gene_type:complete